MRGTSATSATIRDTIAVVVPPDLNVSVSQSSGTVAGGQPLTYTVTVRNTGGLPASAIVVRNTISDQVSFSSASVGAPFNTGCARSGTTVTCTVPVLAPGQGATVRVATLVPASAQGGHDISFSSRVDPDNVIPESNERNNLASAIASTIFSTAGIAPVVWQRTTGEHYRLECPLGQVLSGIHGDSGYWLENIGLVCAGTKGKLAYMTIYGGWATPAAFELICPAGFIPRLALWTPPYNDAFLSRPGLDCPSSQVSRSYDPAKVSGLQGTLVYLTYGGDGLLNPATLRIQARCPDGSFPIGLDVYAERAATGQKGVTGLGMICARLQ
jgi:uncharacterized repeat protein (TIGR01451 family)